MAHLVCTGNPIGLKNFFEISCNKQTSRHCMWAHDWNELEQIWKQMQHGFGGLRRNALRILIWYACVNFWPSLSQSQSNSRIFQKWWSWEKRQENDYHQRFVLISNLQGWVCTKSRLIRLGNQHIPGGRDEQSCLYPLWISYVILFSAAHVSATKFNHGNLVTQREGHFWYRRPLSLIFHFSRGAQPSRRFTL